HAQECRSNVVLLLNHLIYCRLNSALVLDPEFDVCPHEQWDGCDTASLCDSGSGGHHCAIGPQCPDSVCKSARSLQAAANHRDGHEWWAGAPGRWRRRWSVRHSPCLGRQTTGRSPRNHGSSTRAWMGEGDRLNGSLSVFTPFLESVASTTAFLDALSQMGVYSSGGRRAGSGKPSSARSACSAASAGP